MQPLSRKPPNLASKHVVRQKAKTAEFSIPPAANPFGLATVEGKDGFNGSISSRQVIAVGRALS